VRHLRAYRYAERKILRRLLVARAALIAAPIQQDVEHFDAAPELGADLPVDGEQHVVGMHGGADADMRGFVSQARRIGAELAGTLQVDRLGVEGPGAHHHAVHAPQQFGILDPCRQGPERHPVAVEAGTVGNLELRHDPLLAHNRIVALRPESGGAQPRRGRAR
jgi:hypothetical protein